MCARACSDAVNHAPPPAHAQSSGGGSILGGIGSTIAQGMWKIDHCFPGIETLSFMLFLGHVMFIWISISLVLLITGMAFGTGSAVAHRAVDAVMGPRTIQHETVVSEAAAAAAPTASSMGGADACNIHTKAFQDVCTLFLFGYLFAKISNVNQVINYLC